MNALLFSQRSTMLGSPLRRAAPGFLARRLATLRHTLTARTPSAHRPLATWSDLGLAGQQGAMFGLDARIALAIFGVLSVIAGVTAINVLSQAGTTAMVTEIKNIQKAYQEFHLATGEHTTRFMDLIDNQSDILGWNGPYIDLLSDKSRGYGVYSMVEGRQDVAGVPPVECQGGICGVWLKLTKVKDSVAAEVDKSLDSDSSPTSGVFRIEYQPGNTDDVYFLLAAKSNSTAN